MNRWHHQSRGCAEFWRLADANPAGPICITSPTGGGKGLMISDLIHEAIRRSWKVALYSDRKLLTEQTTKRLSEAGIDHGVMADGWIPKTWNTVQLASIQTINSRVYQKQRWELPEAQLVIVDEAHKNCGLVAAKIINDHAAAGAVIAGFTATPLDLGGVYKHLIVAGTNSELRACGALLPCNTYGPDEPDLKHIGPVKVGEDLTEKQNVKAIMRPGVFGRVYDNWRKLNPDARPTILFGPDVDGSLWFCKQFESKGVRAAHIDGERVYFDGQEYESGRESRELVLDMVRAGEIKVLCNRFVLREGIDLPELYHAIFACVFGSPQSYLQSGGRLLRNHASLPGHVVLQDHGGNWWRHGSLNSDRQWSLDYTARIYSGLREERIREKKEQEPIICPQCFKGRLGGPVCPACGHTMTRKVRMVVQKDGSLKPMAGDVFKPRRVAMKSNTERLWESMYHRARKAGMTFRQAEGLFAHENHYWPPRELKRMPVDPLDWFMPVKDVPQERLK